MDNVKNTSDAFKDIVEEEKEEAVKKEKAKPKKVKDKAQIAELKAEVEKFKKLAEDNYKHYQYSMAEFENLKKRVIQDRNEMRKYGIIPFVREILHVTDNLERALEHVDNADKDSLAAGIKMTISQIDNTLEQFGIKKIPAIGEAFDPTVHEGMSMFESKEHAPNTVVHELQSGYILDGRLVRPSKVTISTAPKGASPPEEAAPSQEDAAESTNNNIENETEE